MSNKATIKRLFEDRNQVSEADAECEGIKNLRQQVYFLRKDGLNIINTEPKTYQLLK